MRQIAISEFKAKCLAMLEQVQKTKTPIRITRFGKPIAEVVRVSPTGPRDWMGSTKDRIEILGDIISPARRRKRWGDTSRLKLLLDTHIWLWSFQEPARLGKRVSRELRDPANELWLSPISTW